MGKQVLLEERRLHNLIFRKMRSITGDGGEKGFRLQGMIVSFLCEHAGERICQKDLEAEFFVRGSTMAAAISSLEAAGYVERRSDEADRRLKGVTPTAKAGEADARPGSWGRDMGNPIGEGIRDEELSGDFKVVHKICDNLEADDQ